MKLIFRLLGPFQVELDGQMLDDFRSDKVRGLLTFLAVESQRPWTRGYLANLFWADYSENKAQSNLSNALWNLRTLVGDLSAGTKYINVKKTTLQFNSQSDYWLDVEVFNTIIDQYQNTQSTENKILISDLDKALSLSQGSFMEGFSIDSPGFETWLIKTRQEIHQKRIQALRWISLAYIQSGKLSMALKYTQDWISEEPWDERACRVGMQILVKLGQRNKAVDMFEKFRNRLAEDLGITPQEETQQLYQEIISDQSAYSQPEVVISSAKRGTEETIDPGSFPKNLVREIKFETQQKSFFGRKEELSQLSHWLEESISNNQGKAAFIIGEPGSGKTYLLKEFAQQTLKKHPGLLLFWGQCNAYTGKGDPYFPFITMIKMLAGDFEALIPGAILSEEHLNRLWHYLPAMLDALIKYGPDLAQQFLTTTQQFNIAKKHPGVAQDTLDLMSDLTKYAPKKTEKPIALNDQFNRVLGVISEDHPIILVLDDLQWIDEGSASLLFHLGRHLKAKKVLLLGAFRPSEVTITYDEIKHPLFGILRELRAIYGENMINLAESKGNSFINDLLASEPNTFTTDFHQKLYQHTSGHPLFTIELLRGMQLRNEIIKDKGGKWVESKQLNWEELPARVEAVIARRFDLLPTECQSVMKHACVQGKEFCVEILSGLVSEPEGKVFDLLNDVVGKRHQLITPQGIQKVGKRKITYFRFRHDLFQIYLYGQLNPIERKRLHGLVGNEIENLYENHLSQHPEIALTLAWHFENADLLEKAVQYYHHAGKFAVRLSAHQDAIRHFNHALTLLDQLPDTTRKDELELDLQLSHGPPITALKGWGAPELEKAYDRAQILCENFTNPGKLIPALWLLATFRLGRSEHKEVDRLVARLETLIRKINDPALLALVFLQVSPEYQGKFLEARRLLERAAAIEDIKLQRHLAHRFGMAPSVTALGYLGDCLWMMGYPDQADKINNKALAFAEKIDHPMTTCYVTSRSCWLSLLEDDPEKVGTNAEVLYQTAHKYGFKNFEFAALFFKNWLEFQKNEDGDQDLALDAMQKNIEAYYVTKTVLNPLAQMRNALSGIFRN